MERSAKEIFASWKLLCEADPSIGAKFSGRFVWRVSGEELEFVFTPSYIHLDFSRFELKSDVRYESDEDTTCAIADGRLIAQTAYLEGKLKVSGLLPQIIRLNSLLAALVKHRQV